MLKYFISIFLLSCFVLQAQKSDATKKDSITLKNKYGLRIGIDLFNPTATLIDSKRKGLEIVGDYRVGRNLYIAAELGYIDNNRKEDYIDFTTKGQYIKAGIDFNVYKNWLNMENSIYFGIRYGFSTFSQTLNSATIISPNPILSDQPIAPQEFTGLNAHWAELIVGIKAEVLTNLYLGFSFSGKRMISTKEPNNFKNLFVPGFNRVFLNNSGFGVNYTISYLIPLYKRNK